MHAEYSEGDQSTKCTMSATRGSAMHEECSDDVSLGHEKYATHTKLLATKLYVMSDDRGRGVDVSSRTA